MDISIINQIFKKEDLITGDLFIFTDTRSLFGVTITATIMKNDTIYLICESHNHYPPIVCKIERNFKNSKFVYVSPSLRQIIWISQDNNYLIIPISKILNFIHPSEVPCLVDNNSFSQKVLGMGNTIKPSIVRHDIHGSLPFSTIEMAWWEINESKVFIVFVEKNGIHFLNVKHIDAGFKSFQFNNITGALFHNNDDKIVITTFSKDEQNAPNEVLSNLNVFTFENGEITLNSQNLQFALKSNQQFLIQTSPKNSKWLYSVLQNDLKFYDSEIKKVNVTEFNTDSTDTTSLVITHHFIFYCQKGKVYTRFIQPNHESLEIFPYKADIHLISFESDEVLLSSEKSLVHISLKKDSIDEIFAELAFDGHLDDALFIGQGDNLSIPYLFQYIINEYVKQKNYEGAFKVMQHEKCDLKDTILRFLQSGLDRLALHVALKSHNKAEMFEKSIPLFADRVILKNKIFYVFTKNMNQLFGKNDYLMPPTVFSRSSFFEGYKINDPKIVSKIPLALQFRYNISFGFENDDISVIKSASKLDLPLHPVFSFSAHYKSLLNQYRAMIETSEEELNIDKSCSNMCFYKDTLIYLADKLYINNDPIDSQFEITSFALKGKILYVTDKLLNVYKTELPRIDFIELNDIHPTVKMESNNETIAFLSISGSIFFDDGEFITGKYIDIALGKDYLFAIDDNGELFSISLNSNKKVTNIPIKHFIHAICAVDDIPISIISKNKCIIDAKYYDIDFEFCKSGINEAIIAGGGCMLIINKYAEIEKRYYSQRIGNILNIIKNDGSYYLVGSASPPIKLFNKPIPSNEQPSFNELRLVASKYNEDFLFEIFTKEPFITILYSLFGKWDKLWSCSTISCLEPYINEFSEEEASNLFHVLLNQHSTKQGEGISISDEQLKQEYARLSFINHPEDLKKLNSKQLVSILPPPRQRGKGNLDEISLKFIQKSVNPTIVPSLRFKENKLFVFNCNHILNSDEMLQSVTMIKDFLTKKRLTNTGQFIFDIYLLKKIPAQCPRCLMQRLETYFKS